MKKKLSLMVLFFTCILFAGLIIIHGCDSSSSSSDSATDTEADSGDDGSSDGSGDDGNSGSSPFTGTCLEPLFACIGDIGNEVSCNFDTDSCTIIYYYADGSYYQLPIGDLLNPTITYYTSDDEMCYSMTVDNTSVDFDDSLSEYTYTGTTVYTDSQGNEYTLETTVTETCAGGDCTTGSASSSVTATLTCPNGTVETFTYDDDGNSDYTGGDSSSGDAGSGTTSGDTDDTVTSDVTCDIDYTNPDILSCITSIDIDFTLEAGRRNIRRNNLILKNK